MGSIVAIGGGVVSAGPAAHVRRRFFRWFKPLTAAAGPPVLASAPVALVVRVPLHRRRGFCVVGVDRVGVAHQGGVRLYHTNISHRVTLKLIHVFVFVNIFGIKGFLRLRLLRIYWQHSYFELLLISKIKFNFPFLLENEYLNLFMIKKNERVPIQGNLIFNIKNKLSFWCYSPYWKWTTNHVINKFIDKKRFWFGPAGT